jgi:hypothetical protein
LIWLYARCINIETLFSLGICEEIGQIISNNGALEKLLSGCKKGGLGMWRPSNADDATATATANTDI